MAPQRIAFLVNDIQGLEPSQTTVMLIHQCASMGHEVTVVGVDRIWLDDHDHVCGMGASARPVADRKKQCADLGIQPLQRVDLEEVDLVWIRTNPARDSERAWAHEAALPMLGLCQHPLVLNNPYGLQRASSKLYLHHIPAAYRPRSLITHDPEQLRAFIDEVGDRCVVKPLKGTHGRDVFMLRGSDADNLNQILDIMTRGGHVIAQEFIPEAVEGDVRLILLDGDLLEIDGHVAAVARVPGSGDFRSNIHAGGRARAIEPTPLMREASVVVGERLREDGIFLAGADFIGGKLVEVNTFSPGGLLDSERFYGVEFTAHIIERALAKVAEHRTTR
jgi:glutathione synthase